MNFIAIILNKRSPICFILNQVEEAFMYKENRFQKYENWVGLFYSYFTYNDDGIYFLTNIDYSFASRGVNSLILDSFKDKGYIDFFEGKGEDPISIINISLKSDNEKEIKEEGDFSQLFGNDYLYKCANTNEYCLIFELPDEIKLDFELKTPSAGLR